MYKRQECDRSTLLTHPRRSKGHHADGRRSPLNPSANSVAVLVRQASEPQSGIHTVHSTYRQDRSAKVASPESNVQPCVSKPSLPCRVSEPWRLHAASSAENDYTDDYVTPETTSTSPGTLGAVFGSPGGPVSGPARSRWAD